MSNNYPPANFAKEAVKKIRAAQIDYWNRGFENSELLDSELEEIINNSFKQSICDSCETRMLFDDREKTAKELYYKLREIIQELNYQEKWNGICLSDRIEIITAKQLIEKYKNLES